MINHKGTRMAKDGEDWHGFTNDEFEKLEAKHVQIVTEPL